MKFKKSIPRAQLLFFITSNNDNDKDNCEDNNELFVTNNDKEKASHHL